MVFNRASKEEYDVWTEIGNDGWDWDDLLPSFISSSNYSAITDSAVFPNGLSASASTSREQSFIGTSGEIHVGPSLDMIDGPELTPRHLSGILQYILYRSCTALCSRNEFVGYHDQFGTGK